MKVSPEKLKQINDVQQRVLLLSAELNASKGEKDLLMAKTLSECKASLLNAICLECGTIHKPNDQCSECNSDRSNSQLTTVNKRVANKKKRVRKSSRKR